MATADIVVVGGGIAGASTAAFAAESGARVLLLEREPVLSWHTTGRSAALYLANYGPAQIRRLTLASRSFLASPPDGFTDVPLLSARGMIWVGGAGDGAALRELERAGRALDPDVCALTGDEVLRMCPVLRRDHAEWGVCEPGAADIDVAALHAGFVRRLRACGGATVTAAAVASVQRRGSGWTVATHTGPVHCGILVNAAGAWGDEVAMIAGVRPLGLRPLRRTAATVALPAGLNARAWPAVIHAGNAWYFKPEGDGLLVSPSDETPSAPMDARPQDLDVALALERVAAATTLPLRSARAAWAGLRTFAPDGELVVGADGDAPGFVWCVGQGGYGIQSSPAVGRLTADLATGADTAWATGSGVDIAALGPDRLRGAR